jgi:hypothetical protein
LRLQSEKLASKFAYKNRLVPLHLGLAPDDEIVGELLQAQAALARTLWITRTLAAKALAGAQAAAAAEAADREMKDAWVEETERYEVGLYKLNSVDP